MTKEQVKLICPKVVGLDGYYPLFVAAMEKYEINTPLRKAHFLSQILHETGGFRWMQELATGDAYEGRRDLGNIIKGAGRKFKGRGAIQLTGMKNYERYGKAIGVDLLAQPELVATKYPFDVAGWYWSDNHINQLADRDDVLLVTRRINGGVNGLADREQYLKKAKAVING